MPSAASLRLQIEHALGSRIPGALTPRPRVLRDLSSTGVPELDALLEGGFPVGAISELVGPLSSGRTTLALATAAEMTQAGKTVAWIDASDALSPESAAAAGVDLSRQLWVRCGDLGASSSSGNLATSPLPSTGGAALLSEGSHTAATSGGCGSPHPRGEARGLSQAVDAFLHPDVFSRPAPPRDPATPRKNRMLGTPGAPNRKLLDRTPQDPRPFPRRAKDREEQIPSDRQPTRRQVQEGQQRSAHKEPSLQSAQIANTAVAAHRRGPGHWSDNSNNAHGRALATPPNAIAAGLPRFREAEARANAQPDFVPKVHPGAYLPTPGIAHQGKVQPTTKMKASLAGERPSPLSRTPSPIWQALDQALRATDLLLAAGGFSAVVLDLGSIPPEFAWRIPLATWFRFRAAADRARTVLLVLTQHPCARSSAELVLRLAPAETQAAPTVLTGARFRLTVDRRRFEADPSSALLPPKVEAAVAANKLHLVASRKQPQRESTWHRAASWTAIRTGTEPATNSATGGISH